MYFLRFYGTPRKQTPGFFENGSPSFTDGIALALRRLSDEESEPEPEPEIDWREVDPLAIEIEEVPPESGRWDPREDPYAVEIEDVDESRRRS